MPCIFKPDMHHTWMCIVCHVYACVFTELFVSFRLLLLLASVSFRSCEASSSSSSGSVLLPCGIPGKMTEPGYHYYLCLLLVDPLYSFASMPMSFLSASYL